MLVKLSSTWLSTAEHGQGMLRVAPTTERRSLPRHLLGPRTRVLWRAQCRAAARVVREVTGRAGELGAGRAWRWQAAGGWVCRGAGRWAAGGRLGEKACHWRWSVCVRTLAKVVQGNTL